MNFSLDYSTELEVLNIFIITETTGRYNAIFKVIQHTHPPTIIHTYSYMHINLCSYHVNVPKFSHSNID